MACSTDFSADAGTVSSTSSCGPPISPSFSPNSSVVDATPCSSQGILDRCAPSSRKRLRRAPRRSLWRLTVLAFDHAVGRVMPVRGSRTHLYVSNAAGGTPPITRMPFAGHDFVPCVSGANKDASRQLRADADACRPSAHHSPFTLARAAASRPLRHRDSCRPWCGWQRAVRCSACRSMWSQACRNWLQPWRPVRSGYWAVRSSRVHPPSLHDVEIGLAGQQISSSRRPHNLSASTVPAVAPPDKSKHSQRRYTECPAIEPANLV